MLKLKLPNRIRLAGSDILVSVGIPKSDEGEEKSGIWESKNNAIVIDQVACPVMRLEIFCHELSEAIVSKFVNESSSEEEDVKHEIIDAYGRGIFCFLMDNIHLIVDKEDDGEGGSTK